MLFINKENKNSYIKRGKDNDQPLVFSTPFSSQYRDICKIVQKHAALLSIDPIYSGILENGVRCVSRRAPTTIPLASFLVKVEVLQVGLIVRALTSAVIIIEFAAKSLTFPLPLNHM